MSELENYFEPIWHEVNKLRGLFKDLMENILSHQYTAKEITKNTLKILQFNTKKEVDM